MKNFATMLKPLALSIALFAIFTATQGIARADEVTIAGFTNGCFNCAAPPNSSATQTASLLGLSYTNSTFSGTTANGFRGLGGNPTAAGVQSVNNLGSFNLSTAPNTYNGNSFTVRVTFTLPTGIAGGQTSTYTAMLTGTVISDNQGGVLVDFNNTPQLFTFSFANANGTTTTGSFTFTVNDVAVDPGQNASITGQITGAQQTAVPEPATMILLGTGLAGIAARMRKRRKDA